MKTRAHYGAGFMSTAGTQGSTHATLDAQHQHGISGTHEHAAADENPGDLEKKDA
jgi:hypothetical protein